ncbi:ABC transporter ATP-binding protein [Deinococcus aerophilus]|uniref:ABC transporter ATP-binding protein n=1 Tax=Deinococcus aerophilus TaxID=522488 RepID=A0ABQ2GMA5_9DEIO|nr:ABC transporter ATP-binding protein [Deinococcus aerophilus]GGM02183.1 ABC transporter ATP-binding protein [Deinococcus aerophilus]
MTTVQDRPDHQTAPPSPLAARTSDGLGRSLSLTGVGYRYGGRGQSGAGVGPLNLHIAPGEFVCVVGPSGGGKSTLLSLLAGFLAPQSGQIQLGGEAVRGPHPGLTLVQQEAALFPWLTVTGNVAFGLRGLKRSERAARVSDALRQVGLAGYGPRRVHELSGGQRQRVALARALAVQPGVLLLDEPFSALDHATRTALADELLGLWWQHKLTVVFVTHQLDEALHLGGRILALKNGEVALDAPAKTLSVPRLREVLE